jgi:hypothetical protein
MTTQIPLTAVTTSQTLSTTQSTITSSITITTTQNPTTITQTTITTTQNPTSTMTTQTLSTTVTNTMTTQTLSTTVTNTMTTTQNPTTTTITQTLSTTITITNENLTNTTTTTQPLINNYYIQFSFSLSVSDGNNITDSQLATELTSIFINALGISSNQISITISTGTSRSRAVIAQVRFFSTASVSADNLLSLTETQLADPNSQLRQATLTSQLNQNSIVNIERYYTCSNGVVQESPCTTSDTSNSGTPLSTILLASIIPSVFVFFVLIVVAFFLIRYIRRPSFRPRPSRFDRF